MKTFIARLTLLFFVLLNQPIHAATGSLFDVTATGDSALISITLCLNGNAALSCQNYQVTALTLSILTTAPNHTYPAVGIKINTPGFTLDTGCSTSQNGYCLFTANDTSAQTITIIGSDTETFSIGGTVSGLTASGLVLQNNLTDNLTVPSDATSFTFGTEIPDGNSYSVTVLTQPTGQTCTVTNGTGTATADVTNVVVACSTDTFSIGGTVSGLTASGLVLQNNLTDNLAVSSGANSFTFGTEVSYGNTYSVTVLTQPTGQTCTVTNGTGTATADVTNVVVTCSTDTFTIGGTLSGLGGGNTVVLNNASTSENLSVSTDGTFTFLTPVAYGNTYSVTVFTQPTGQTCTVTNGAGTATADVTNVVVTCSTDTFTIGGTLSGLGAGKTVVLNNASTSENLPVGTNGSFTFLIPVAYGGSYTVTVDTAPTGQSCTVTDGSGTGVMADVTNIVVSCFETPTLYAGTDSTSSTNPGSLYIMSLDNASSTLSTSLTNNPGMALGSNGTNLFHFTGSFSTFNQVYESIQIGTGTTPLSISGQQFYTAQGVAYSGGASGNFLSSTNNSGSSGFGQYGTLTPANGDTRISINELTQLAEINMRGFACFNNVLYAVDSTAPSLYDVNTSNGLIDATYSITLSGFTVSSGSAITADPYTGTLYALLNINDNTQRLVTLAISGSTAVATDIGETGAGNFIFSALAFHPTDNPTCTFSP